MDEQMKVRGVKLRMTTSYRAHADGQMERQNRVLEDALRCMVLLQDQVVAISSRLSAPKSAGALSFFLDTFGFFFFKDFYVSGAVVGEVPLVFTLDSSPGGSRFAP
ncbi:hypothetical protein L916_19359 [Phytophthora nicotianae]|uniref:Integrase catalytic domain-containing protein n=1 Tax=Phytophthora nicotianae TaxID=4792 RepID=W2HYM1_PHYNI|nr:hypothetical protein L916_19359 [Phytophthora nicotianae]